MRILSPELPDSLSYKHLPPELPKRKNVLINDDRLTDMLGMQSYDIIKQHHTMWVYEELAADRKQRKEKWTKSIAVGGKEFVKNVKIKFGSCLTGRGIQESDAAYQLREPSRTYKTNLGVEKAI